MTTKTTPSLADNIFGGIFLVGILGAVVLGVALVSKPSSPDPQPQAQRRVSPPAQASVNNPAQRASTIVATIREFKLGIPLLEQIGLSQQKDPGGIEYRWVSGVSWIKFYDFGADGKLDRISAVLATPQDESNTVILSAMLAMRLIQLASGKEMGIDEFNAWIASVAGGDAVRGQARTINRTPMCLQGVLTTDGKTGMRLTIGELSN